MKYIKHYFIKTQVIYRGTSPAIFTCDSRAARYLTSCFKIRSGISRRKYATFTKTHVAAGLLRKVPVQLAMCGILQRRPVFEDCAVL